MPETTYFAGSLNIKKQLKQLGRYDGSNFLDLLKEFIDNSFDAKAKNISIVFNTNEKKIIISDNGKGMQKESVLKFFEMYSDACENADDSVDGKFGIGAKKACAVLSRLGKVQIETVRNNKISNAEIDYEKIIKSKEKDAYCNSVKVKENDTDSSSYTKITISVSDHDDADDTDIFDYFKDKIKSRKIEENMIFDLSYTYSYKIKNQNNIVIKLDEDEEIKVPHLELITDNEDYIYKKIEVQIYSKKNKKTLAYVISNNDEERVCEYPFNTFEIKSISGNDEYSKIDKAKFSLEFCFPKSTCGRPTSKNEANPRFECYSNQDVNDPNISRIIDIYGFESSFSEIIKHLKNLEVVRNRKTLATLPIELNSIFKGTDAHKKNEYEVTFKRIKFKSSCDKYIKLAQETKSKVDWSACSRGIKKVFMNQLKEFVESEVKKFLNRKCCKECHPNTFKNGDYFYTTVCNCPDTNHNVSLENSDQIPNMEYADESEDEYDEELNSVSHQNTDGIESEEDSKINGNSEMNNDYPQIQNDNELEWDENEFQYRQNSNVEINCETLSDGDEENNEDYVKEFLRVVELFKDKTIDDFDIKRCKLQELDTKQQRALCDIENTMLSFLKII